MFQTEHLPPLANRKRSKQAIKSTAYAAIVLGYLTGMPATVEELITRLRRNPDDREAFSTLRKHYNRMADYPSLANLLEGWASKQTDAEAAADAFVEAAHFAQRLGDQERGVSLLERALHRSPTHAGASEQLETLVEASGDYDRLVRLIQQRIQILSRQGDNTPAVALLHFRLAELWRHRFSRTDRAIYHFRKAFEIDSSLVAAVYAAREIYRAEGNWRMAATLCEQEAQAERDPNRRAALLRELAGIRHMHLNDQKGAIAALTTASELAAEDVNILYELAGLLLQHAAQEKNPAAAEAERHRAADFFYRVARLTLSELQLLVEQQGPSPDAELFQRNFVQHAIAYLQAALDANPGHSAALQLLESTATEAGNYENLLPERWVAFLEEAADDPLAQPVRQRLGHAYAIAGQVQDAITCLEPLLDASDPWAAEVLVGLYRSLNNQAGMERALGVLIQTLPPEKQLDRLREMVHLLANAERRTDASTFARQALDIDPADAEMLAFLEDELQGRQAWDELRDLSLTAARVPGLSIDAKLHRLRQAARISEERLSDTDGAIGAWRAVTSLDPANAEACEALERLLRQANRWDDLIQVLERSALALTDPIDRANAYLAMARIHRDQRQDFPLAIACLVKTLEEIPDNLEANTGLSALYLQQEQYHDAIPVLRQLLEIQDDANERVRVLSTLGRILEDPINDDEAAFKIYRQLLEETPDNLDALQGLERIDARAGRYHNLLETLGYHAELVDESERAALYVRMGNLADRELDDLEKASQYYRQAVELNPTDGTTLDALCNLFERTSRHKDLVVYLRRRAEIESDPHAKVELYRRIARTLTESLGTPDTAAEVWTKLVDIQADTEALQALREYYVSQSDFQKLDAVLQQLAELTEDSTEKRDFLYARAEGLYKHLDQPADAITVLQTIVHELDGQFVPALDLLVDLSEQTENYDSLADALERKLVLCANSPDRQLDLAKRLADLYSIQIQQPQSTERALLTWTQLDPNDPEPHRRLVNLLRDTDRALDLRNALDTLTRLETDADAQQAAGIEAATISEQLQDIDGAWTRLLPAVRQDNPQAVEALTSLAKTSNRGMEFASVYVELAQQVQDPQRQGEYWQTAAKAYEEHTNEIAEALEAMLRAFATDLNNEHYLDEIDRLAIRVEAWRRLEQVYDTLLRNTDDVDRKVGLLLRHAAIVESKAQDPSSALDRLLRASALKPTDPELITRIETLAKANDRAEELLVIYDRLRLRAENSTEAIDALIRAIRTCAWDLANPKRALHYLDQAARLALEQPEFAARVEGLAEELDSHFAATGVQSDSAAPARETLVSAYSKLYGHGDAEVTPSALIHIAHYFAQREESKPQVLEAIRTAASLDPGNPAVLESLTQFCSEQNMLPDLVALLGGLADDALDAPTAIALLERRGKILEDTLQRYGEAAQSYQQLLLLRHDAEIAERLHRCLRKTEKFNDLLVALGRALDQTEIPDERFNLYREIARVWEEELNNRFEAIEALQKALQIRPDDRESLEQLERLSKATRPTDDELWQEVDEKADHVEVVPSAGVEPTRPELVTAQSSIPPPLPTHIEQEDSSALDDQALIVTEESDGSDDDTDDDLT